MKNDRRKLKEEAVEAGFYWLISTLLFAICVLAGVITLDQMWNSLAAVSGYMVARIVYVAYLSAEKTIK